MEDIKETPLCKLAYKYGTDKCPRIKHNYTPYYYELLKDKKIKKVIEIGIGYYENIKYGEHNWDKNLKRKYHRGASLKMWRDFLLEAQIYGVDIQKDTMFKDRRIKTFVYDERRGSHMKELIKKTGADIDLFIDDGSHSVGNQVRLAKLILPMLDNGAIYIIEDVGRPNYAVNALSEYKCIVPRLLKFAKHTTKDRLILIEKRVKDDNLIVIKK